MLSKKVTHGSAAPFIAQCRAVGNLGKGNIHYLLDYCLKQVDMFRNVVGTNNISATLLCLYMLNQLLWREHI